MVTVVRRIVAFNRGRLPMLLERKYARMAQDPFAFYRATAHLFYEDLVDDALPDSPAAWCCGDLHLENFGTFKGDNGLTYFDVNDFDHAALLPLAWELARFATSVWVGGAAMKLEAAQRLEAMRAFLDRYRESLLEGRALWIERATADGDVRKLLHRLRRRRHAELLAERTEGKGKRRQLSVDKEHTLELSKTGRARAIRLLRASQHVDGMTVRFKMADVARRVAGLGSLGVERYIVLVRGVGRIDGHYLLDVKEARRSVAAVRSPCPQPRWTSEATRVVALQHRIQAASPAFLTAVGLHNDSYVIKALQPTEDRLALSRIAGRRRAFRRVIETMAKVVAWGHMRAAARQGSAGADELGRFAAKDAWATHLIRYARRYGAQVEEDFGEFAKAWNAEGVR